MILASATGGLGVLGAILVVIALVVLYQRSRGRFYGRLFSTDHYAELAVAGLKLRDALRGAMEKNPRAKGYGPGEYRSHQDVAVIASIHRVPGGVVYHLSLSSPGDVMAFAAGGRLLYLLAGALGIQDHIVAVAHTPITHGIFRLTEEEHAEAEPAFGVPESAAQVEHLKNEAGLYLGRLHDLGPLHTTEEGLLKSVGME